MQCEPQSADLKLAAGLCSEDLKIAASDADLAVENKSCRVQNLDTPRAGQVGDGTAGRPSGVGLSRTKRCLGDLAPM